MSAFGQRRAETGIGKLLRDTLKSLFFCSLFLLLSHSDTLFPLLMDCLALYSIFPLPYSIFLLVSLSPHYFHINLPSGYLIALFWLCPLLQSAVQLILCHTICIPIEVCVWPYNSLEQSLWYSGRLGSFPQKRWQVWQGP